MKRWSRRVTLAAGATLATALCVRKPQAQEPAIGRLILRDPPTPLAGLRWQDEHGAPAGLARFTGFGVVLNVWATWCAPCVAELPSLAALNRTLSADRIVVVAVSSDIGGAAVVRPYYAAHSISGIGIWLDEHGQTIDAIGAVGLPTTLIIDRQGRETARLLGPANWSTPDSAAAVRALCDL